MDMSKDPGAAPRMSADESKLASFARLSPNILLEIASDGTIVFSNNSARDAIRSVTGKEDLSLFIPPDMAVIQDEFKQGWRGVIQREVNIKGNYFIELFVYDVENLTIKAYINDITDEKRIHEEKDNLSRIVENTSDFAGLATLDGTVLFINRAAEAMTGISCEEAIGRNIRDFSSRWVLDRYVMPSLLEHGKWQGEEAVRNLVTGERHIMALNVFHIKNPEGVPILIAVVMKDISWLKNAEAKVDKALRESESRRMVMEVLFSTTTKILELDDFNETARLIFRNCKELVGAKAGFIKTCDENGDFEIVPEVDTGQFISTMKVPARISSRGLRWEAIASGKPVLNNDLMAGWTAGLVPEGHMPMENVLFAPMLVSGKAVGLLGFANKPGGFTEDDASTAAAFADLAALALGKVKGTENLRASEERFKALFDNAPIGYQSLDESGRILEVNKAWLDLMGYQKEDVIGRSFRDFLSPVSKEELPAKFKALLAQGEVVDCELVMMDKRGKDLHVAFNGRIAVGEITGVNKAHCIFYDLSERKKAEVDKEKIRQQMLQLQKMEAIGTLAGGIAHDFNNYLTVIQGFSDIIMEKIDDSNPLYFDIKNINSAASRAQSLTRQLLLFSRQQPMESRVLDVNGLLESLAKMLSRLIGENINLGLNLDPGVSLVMGDDGNLSQVFTNIVVNAKDAMLNGGNITIRTWMTEFNASDSELPAECKPGRYVVIDIADSGSGMSKEVLERIFDPFFTTKPVGKGTGLGLPVSFGIVKQHGGWISVQSEPGLGTMFSVFLPATDARLADTGRDGSRLTIASGSYKGKGERILLVEDEENVRTFANIVLTDNGYKVVEASCVKEALEIFNREKGRFDFVFSDTIMPDGTGIDLVLELISIRADIPVLLCSGYTDLETQWSVIQNKKIPFLQKPYQMNALLKAVRGMLDTDKGASYTPPTT